MVLAVTGGVGCGKSTILEILENKFGAKIIVADDVARDLQMPGGKAFKEIVKAFGHRILNPYGEINRAQLAEIVFADPEKLKLLNSIVHPSVKTEIKKMIRKYYRQDKNALIVLESAIILEAGYEDVYDDVWAIYVEKEVRVKRLIESRGYSREKIEDIMSNQKSDEDFRKACSFVIDNSGDIAETERSITEKFREMGIYPKNA